MVGLEYLIIFAYDAVFSSIEVSDLELSESMLPLLVSSFSMTCILLLFSSGDFIGDSIGCNTE